MKCQDFATFKKKFEEQPSLILILAKEEKEVVKKALALWKGGSIVSFDSETFCPKRFLEEIETLSFFEKKRFVTVSEIDHLESSSLETLLNYALKPNPRALLLLSATNLNANSKLVKACDEQGIVFQLVAEKPWEKEKRLIEWLTSLTAKEGVTLAPPAAKKLLLFVGQQEELLFQELQKLICFAAEKKKISPEDVDILVFNNSPVTLWQLGEAIFRLDLQNAILMGRTLLEETSLLPLIIHLRSQVQTALEMTSHLEQGGQSALVKAFPYLKGAILEKKISSLRYYGPMRLRHAFLALVEGELRAKNSNTNPELLLELLLYQLCRSTYSPTH